MKAILLIFRQTPPSVVMDATQSLGGPFENIIATNTGVDHVYTYEDPADIPTRVQQMDMAAMANQDPVEMLDQGLDFTTDLILGSMQEASDAFGLDMDLQQIFDETPA